MADSRQLDVKMLLEHSPEKLLDIFFTHIRNVWRVDGLYFLGIEERFGTEAATDIDAYCHQAMGSIEAKALIKTLGLEKRDLDELVTALKHSCWSLDLQQKEYRKEGDRVVLTVTECATQLTRLKKGLPVFPCKRVRFGYLQEFVRTFNPDLGVNCLLCPSEKRPEGAWCRWEFYHK